MELRVKPGEEMSRLSYDILKKETESTLHGVRFKVRKYSDDDPYNLLSLETGHVPAKQPFDIKRFNELGNILDNVLVTPESRQGIVEEITRILLDRDVARHLHSGGNIAFVTNHISYIDLPLLMYSLAEAKLRLSGGRNAETENHHVISSRQVSLFQMYGLGKDGGIGNVVDDGLLDIGGVFQTVPVSTTGGKIPEDITRIANGAFGAAYGNQLKKGGQIIFIAPSGTQDKYGEDGKLHMAHAEKGTVNLLARPNRLAVPEGLEGSLLCIPVFIDCQPFDKDGNFNGPAVASFKFGSPSFPTKPDDVQAMMYVIEEFGKKYKHPSTPEIVYERVSRRKALGSSAVKAAR